MSDKKKKTSAPEVPTVLTGSFCFPNGDKYSGEYTNDSNGMCRNGQGNHAYANGKVYSGNWKDDNIHGQGCLTFPNGSKYEGSFVDNAFNGEGEYTWQDGSKYKGKFANNKKLEHRALPFQHSTSFPRVRQSSAVSDKFSPLTSSTITRLLSHSSRDKIPLCRDTEVPRSVHILEPERYQKEWVNLREEMKMLRLSCTCQTRNTGKNLHLLEFLLEMLADRRMKSLITWTGQDREFRVVNSREVAREWGNRKNKPHMNFDKMSRAMRYYYKKNILTHVNKQRLVFSFGQDAICPHYEKIIKLALRTGNSNQNKIKISKETKHFNDRFTFP